MTAASRQPAAEPYAEQPMEPSGAAGVPGAAADWSSAFRRSTVHPAVFTVHDGTAATRLLAWAVDRSLAHRHKAYAFSVELDGWALLDGGLSYLQSRARGRLRSGLRVVGWSTLRLLAAELDLARPSRLLVGEPWCRSDAELRHLADDGWVVLPPPARQATMLVGYVDARGLADVASKLVGPCLRSGPAAVARSG